MSIDQTEIDRIKETRSVLEFMEDPRRVGRCYRSRCPLPGHDDRTPSFYLYPDGGYWCFGCGRGGKDVISFAFHYWRLSWPRDFPQALERLGARMGEASVSRFRLPASTTVTSSREVRPRLPDAATLAVYQVAAAVWQDILWKATGRDALVYLHGRGLTDDAIRREGIGYAADTLTAALREHGLDPAVAKAAGLLHANGHEIFTGRVVLWEWRHVGGVRMPVWATARTCATATAWDDAGKYLNVRGDRLLGGLESAIGHSAVAVVEGAFDRLAVQACGDAAVFLGSSDPPDAVLAELRDLARRAVLYLIRDQDRAGRRGSWRTLARLDLPPAARVVFVNLPAGFKDPGELAARPDGAALYQKAKQGGRTIDPERLKSRCRHCAALVARHKAATPRRGRHSLLSGKNG